MRRECGERTRLVAVLLLMLRLQSGTIRREGAKHCTACMNICDISELMHA